jgi:hypothetical protein
MEDTLYAVELAGHCNELTAWRILKEISEAMLADTAARVSPTQIAIKDDGGFALSRQDAMLMEGFEAPESLKGESNEASAVWSLAATLFYLVMGCQVMNGKGGAAQQESSRLPYMRSSLPVLSELIQRCLSYHSEQRPSLQEVNELANQQYSLCSEAVKNGPAFQDKHLGAESQEGDAVAVSEYWPESMRPEIETNE